MADWIASVETAYDLSGDLHGWMLRVADASKPLLRADDPPIVALVRRSRGATQVIHSACEDPSRVDRQKRLLASRSPEANARVWAFESELQTMSERVFSHLPEEGDRYRRILGGGYQDIVFLHAPTGEGYNLVVWVPVRDQPTISPGDRVRGSRVAAHLGAGVRLRLTLDSASEPGLPVEAVLEPGGALRDASGVARGARARDRLRDAVKRRERARSRKARSDPRSESLVTRPGDSPVTRDRRQG